MKLLWHISSVTFVIGLFTALFAGMPGTLGCRQPGRVLVAEDSGLLPFGRYSAGAGDNSARTRSTHDIS